VFKKEERSIGKPRKRKLEDGENDLKKRGWRKRARNRDAW